MAGPLTSRQPLSYFGLRKAVTNDRQLLTHAIWRYAQIETQWMVRAEYLG